MTKVLGINSFFEHPSAVLLHDDQILYAVEDERFTGIKHGRKYSPFRTYLPVDAIYHALADTGTAVGELDEIAYSYSPRIHLASLWGCFTGQRFDGLRDELSAYAAAVNVRRLLRGGYELPLRYRSVMPPERLGRTGYREWGHHLSHAASAFFCSGWDRALVVVADGSGERACTSVYLGSGDRLTRIGGEDLPHSLGIFYSMVTRHLGFEPFSDEFKVMGLAAYGEPAFRSQFGQLVRLRADGSYRVDAPALRSLDPLLGAPRVPGGKLTQRHRDIARSAQERLEEALKHVVGHYAQATGERRVCLAGGTFLNCVANGQIARLPEVDEVFVQPAAHDAGTALGAASLSMIRLKGPHQLRFGSVALGSEHSDQEYAAACAAAGVPSRRLADDVLAEELAARLADGEIIAVFRGRMEFGPRALGMRSILADPRLPDMRDRLNRLKSREQFRPVAPIVSADAFDRYFDGVRNRYMLFTTQVRSEMRGHIPSAVHADSTARVQAVGEADDAWLHGLLQRFGHRTGTPVLINTSLNVRGKPIVESPADALACLFTTGLDALVLGNRIVERRAAAGAASSAASVSEAS